MQSQDGMPLAKALRVERGAVVSFVGGGGKTTSMFRLAGELRAEGFRVVTTTTTHISEEQVQYAPAAVTLDDLASLTARLDQHGHCLLVGRPDGKGRVFGASSELVATISARPDVDAVLVEADGSKSRPFKAPGEHEPVVPERTTILVPIAGLNSIGRPLDEKYVHRPEIVSALVQAPIGSVITAETVARVLAHPQGGAKNRPAGARLAPLLNKADTDTAVQLGGELAARLLQSPAVDTVIISSMQQERPAREAWTPVAGIILAAGRANRLGITKQILRREDTALAAHWVRTALDAGLDPIVVVLGHEAEKMEKSLSDLPVRTVFNSEYAAGQSTSLAKGLETLPPRTGAALFLLADQPLVEAGTIRKIARAHRLTLAPACVPVFEGKLGNPVLFDKVLFRELRELRGDEGGRALLERYRDALVPVPAGREVLPDIETPEDCERLKQL
jgi:molybdenum cofactor cytidylyltransferase